MSSCDADAEGIGIDNTRGWTDLNLSCSSNVENDEWAKMRIPFPARSALTARTTAVPLDPWYGQDAGPALDAHGLASEPVPGRAPRPSADFYARPSPLVIREAMRARGPLAEHLARLRPDVLVVGNDRGLLEKVALDAARTLGARTVLLQDGERVEIGSIAGRRGEPS